MIPLWSILALTAALLATSMPLLQERYKADAFALSYWIKIFTIFFSLPYVLKYGLPLNWQFYAYVGATSALYSISDVIYFREVPKIGSGLVTRLLPASVVITFFLWFAVDPELIRTYASSPGKSFAIIGVLVFFLYCATHVKKCAVSWDGVKKIWFVIFAACIGPIFSKLSLEHATKDQAVYAYIFAQAVIFCVLFTGAYAIRKPITSAILFSRNSIQTGFIIGLIMALMSYFKIKSFQLVDNPGFASMVMFTDALWVLLVYKFIGRKESANIWAGLGIVLSAALIVLIKSV